MTGPEAFIRDQLAAAVDEAAERFAQTPPANKLTAHHPATAVLVAMLADALPTLTPCDHLQPALPTYARWAPGWPQLRCTLCSIAAFTTNHDPRCDTCGRPSDRDLGSATIVVGPIAVVMVGCTSCRTRTRRRGAPAVDLRTAGRRVVDELFARAMAATA